MYFKNSLLFICIYFCYVTETLSQVEVPDTNVDVIFGRAIKCKRDDGISQRCMPVFENVAYDKPIIANNTCGLKNDTLYCVQTGTSGAKKNCEKCDSRVPGLSHPANLMTDTKIETNPTWWQSETLYENKYGVHLLLDFKKKYNIAFVRIRFHTIRPHSFAIYKKSTYDSNEKWLPYQFYSRTCQKTYGLPNNGVATIENQKIAFCTDKESRMTPLSGGNVAYVTLEHRPGRKNFDQYPALQDWVTVTQLKINLDKLNTFGDEVFGDPKVLRSYYFAISDIAVGGRCKCNGHASNCARDDSGGYRCECDHNTAGKDCEMCLPLYNDRPWSRAIGKDAKPCRKCNCNGLADRCIFDEQLYIDSNYVSGGRCLNCQQNTAGKNCERCKEYHFRESGQYCAPCNCNQVGSHTLSCNGQGACTCKKGVTGKKCGSCKSGFYGLSYTGCTPCNCNEEGSVSSNCNAIGQCKCKENVIGQRCDQCKANHFDLDTGNPKGCKACFCYGHGVSCTSAPGIKIKEIRSEFETGFDGWKMEDYSGKDYGNRMVHQLTNKYVSVNNENGRAATDNTELYFVAPSRYLGNKLSSYGKTFSFVYGLYREIGDPDIRPTSEDIILEGAGIKASYRIIDQNNERPKSRFVKFSYKLVEPVGMSIFDFQKLLSNLTAIKIRVTYLTNRLGAIDTVVMQSTQYVSVNSAEQVTWKEQCECQVGYAGDQCQRCADGYTREFQNSGPLGKCIPCECNNHGTRCDPESGVCICKDNTTGRNCEICKEGFYGNPTRGNPDDCKPCPCVYGNKCILLGDQVKCTDCPEGHEGPRCEKCKDGYFGDPERTQTRCQKCDCNGNVNPNVAGNCNTFTGACLRCIKNTKNGPEKKCELCADGFYGDALNGNCTACKCNENGTEKPVGFQPGDLISCDGNGVCKCLNNVIGKRCDMCPAGHWNVKSGNGCETCGCHEDGAIDGDCDIETGKCKCKPGVTGRTCNQCADGHYSFTSEGCRACNCHPDGSESVNCTEDGECKCKPGVLGIKCDQCPENKFNLSVGCIACPKCFNLVQIAVNKLREKLETLTIGNNTNQTTDINFRDRDFEVAIRELDKEVKKLRSFIDNIVKGDRQLSQFFSELSTKYQTLFGRVNEMKKMLNKSKGEADKGQVSIKRAEEIIEEIKRLLVMLEKRIDNELENINKASNKTGDSSDVGEEMRKIAKEAREIADSHEKDAANIKMTSDMAYNTSEKAYKTAKMARDTEEKMNKDLKKMNIDSTEAERLADESRKFIKRADNESTIAIVEAEKLLAEAKKIPDLKAEEKKAEANDILRRGNNASTLAKELLNENEPKIDKLAKDNAEARRLMKEGEVLVDDSNRLYEDAKNASDRAVEAQRIGLKVAKEAKKMLKDLQGFEQTIKQSKKNASEALKLIPLIKRLIKEANETTTQADNTVSSAEGDAKMSFDIATEASNTTDKAKKEINNIMNRARYLLNETMSFLLNEVAETKKNISKINEELENYKRMAEEDAKAVDKARNDSLSASELAKKADDDLSKSLNEVDSLISFIDNLDTIDFATLEDAERRFKAANSTIEGTIQMEFEFLQRKIKEQDRKIKEYEDNLVPLERQIEFVKTLFNTLPQVCFKVKDSFEERTR